MVTSMMFGHHRVPAATVSLAPQLLLMLMCRSYGVCQVKGGVIIDPNTDISQSHFFVSA